MKNALILVVLILSVFSMKKADAGILLEPYFGIHPFSSEFSSGSNSNDISGTAFGARAGWQTLGLMFGGNYKTGSFKNDDNGSDVDSYTHTGVFIGYNFPIMIRFWAEYILSSNVEFEGGTELEKGTGTTFGFGYTGFPFVSINLEMTKVDGYENAATGNDSNIEVSTTMLSLSFPFNF